MSATAPQAIARRPKPRPGPRPADRTTAANAPAPASKAPAAAGFVATFDPSELRGFDSPMGTDFFDTLGRISAYGVVAEPGAPARRGYPPDSLKVVAQIATHYLYSGGYRLAEVLFSGLTTAAPEEAYHWLGLGLSYDRLDRPAEAERAYRRAAERAPHDARALVNLAELRVEAGAIGEAKELLARAVTLAERAKDEPLLRKARGMLERFAGRRSQGGRRA